MDQGSLEKFKFDKRLQTRRGWLDPAERKAMEEALPDAAEEIAVPEQSEAEAPAPSETPSTPEV